MSHKLSRFLVFAIVFTIPLVFASKIEAHQSGCHRWHSCPSDSGSYSCGDLGYPCRYDTYPAGGYTYVPTYFLPAPQAPTSGKWMINVSNKNWCNQDVLFTWDKGVNADRYSIAASKTAGADPGPLSDTTTTSYTISNLTPGKWYVNVKGGNSERWGSVKYWTIDVPKPTPSLGGSIQTKDGKQYLHYQISCLAEVRGPNEWVNYLSSHDNAPTGDVLLTYTNPTEIVLTGTDRNKKEYSTKISYTPVSTSSTNSSSNDETPWGGILLFTGGLIFVALKITTWFLSTIKNLVAKLRKQN